MKNRIINISPIILLLALLALVDGVFLVIGLIFKNFIYYIGAFLSYFPFIVRFLFAFLVQEFIMMLLLLISIGYYYLGNLKIVFIKLHFRSLLNYFISFFKDQFKWLGFSKVLYYVITPFLVYLFVMVVINYLLTKYGINIPGLFGEQKVSTFLTEIKWNGFYDYIVLFMSVAILGPLVEEVIFRGFVTKIMLSSMPTLFAIFLSAFVFAAIHMEWAVFLNLFVLSIFLSYIFYKTRSLIYTFLFHFLINGMGVLGIIFINN